MERFASVNSLPDPDELLLELGYKFAGYELQIASPEDIIDAKSNGTPLNRTSAVANDVSSLIDELHENSSVLCTYIADDHAEDITRKFSQVLRIDPELHFDEFYSEIQELKEIIEEGMEPSDEDEFPERISHPYDLEADFSQLERYQEVYSKLEELGYPVDAVIFSSSSPSTGQNTLEVEKAINQSCITFKSGEVEATYFNMPEGDYFNVIPSEDAVEKALVDEGFEVA